MCEQGVLVGIPNLRDEMEVMNHSISLSKLRYIIKNVLMLNPFMSVLERHIVDEIALTTKV